MAQRVVTGVYKTENEVVSAIRRLQEIGYKNDDISVLAKDPERFNKVKELTDIDTESPKSAVSGAGTGAVTGGVLGGVGALLVSLGVLVIPGVGPFLAAGPIAAALGGLAAGGTVGGIVGALAGLGVEKGDAEHYQRELDHGSLLVLVKADNDRYDRVTDIFYYPEEEYYTRYERGETFPLNPDSEGSIIPPIPPFPLDYNR